MGGRIAPPADELFSPSYAKAEDKSDIWWRNIFENPTTVQFDHRCLVCRPFLFVLHIPDVGFVLGYHHILRHSRIVHSLPSP